MIFTHFDNSELMSSINYHNLKRSIFFKFLNSVQELDINVTKQSVLDNFRITTICGTLAKDLDAQTIYVCILYFS